MAYYCNPKKIQFIAAAVLKQTLGHVFFVSRGQMSAPEMVQKLSDISSFDIN